MSTAGNELLNQVLQLPRAEQQTLIATLLLQLEQQSATDADADAAWEAEVERRARAIADGSMQTLPGPATLAALRQKHS